MKLFRSRPVLATAYEWKRERERQIQMQIEIEAAVLRSLRTDLAELRQLEGAGLAARFVCETPEDLARTMQGQRTWLEEMKALWIGHKHPEKRAA